MLMFSLWLMFCLVNFPRAFITDLNLPHYSTDCTASTNCREVAQMNTDEQKRTNIWLSKPFLLYVCNCYIHFHAMGWA